MLASHICNLAPSEACTPLECLWRRVLYFLHVLVANCVVHRVDICHHILISLQNDLTSCLGQIIVATTYWESVSLLLRS